MHPITHWFWNFHSRCNRWSTFPLIRNKNFKWATSPPKLRLRQHLTALFVPLTLWGCLLGKVISAFSTQLQDLWSWWTPYQIHLPKWPQGLLKKNIRLLLQQDGMKPFIVSSVNCAHWIPSKLSDPTRFFHFCISLERTATIKKKNPRNIHI